MKSNISPNNLKCSLHLQPFSLYCDQCLQPVCQKCTYIGPHNTTIHSLIPLHQAYQRRVQQINTRLSNLCQTRQSALNKIMILADEINTSKIKYQQIHIQHDKNRMQIENRLDKNSQNIISLLQKQQQQIISHLNQINDLGHQFQTLSSESDIDCLINYERIMEELRQAVDKLQIIIEKNLISPDLPKQLSEIRIKLHEIQNYKELYNKKLQVIKNLIKKLEAETKKIQSPKIQYEAMLIQINKILLRYEQPHQQQALGQQRMALRKAHYVCHFCGVIIGDQEINTACLKNKIVQQIKPAQSYGSYYNKIATTNSSIELNKVGYCIKQPEIVFYGTQRHYFNEPLDPNTFFRVSYFNCILGKQALSQFLQYLPPTDTALCQINQSEKQKSKGNSFSNYLSLLFLKIMTIAKLKNCNIEKLFKKEDILGVENSIGYCQMVAMQYILMQIIKLNQKQTNIVLHICDYATKDFTEINQSINKGKKESFRNYGHLIDVLKMIKI